MIYNNILELANKKGLTLKELERKAGLANGAISKWKVNIPRTDNLKSVADVLNVKVDRLLRE